MIYGCSRPSPYPEFESKLKNQLCECLLINKTDTEELLKNYEICQAKLSKILRDGLDGYEENKDVSKEEYLEQLPELIYRLRDECRFNY